MNHRVGITAGFAVYDRSGLEGVEEAEQRKKILRRMKELQVSEGDWTKAKQVLQEAEISREQMRSGHLPPVKPKEPKVCEERRQVRTKLEEAELEYELRRERERQREMELAAEREQEAERLRELEKQRQLRILQEKEEDLLVFLDRDRFGSK
eukprot:EG_transcript_29262